MNEVMTIDHNLPLTAGDVRKQVNLIQEVMRDVMKKDSHFGLVPGCGDKPTLLQPGAQKLLMTFRLVADPEMTIIPMERGHREVRCKVKIYSQAGVFLGAGVGTCSTMEGKYRYRTGPVEFTDKPVPKLYWDIRNSDPVKAKALLGEGMIPKKNEAGLWVCARQGEKVEHDNPADYYNTVEKMSYKRGLVSAVLTVTAASDIFTQDIEDMPEVIPQPAQKPVEQTAQAKPVEQQDLSIGKVEVVPQDKISNMPASIMTAGNTCGQLRLCESFAEMAQIMNQWLAEWHTAEEMEQVNKVLTETKKRLGGKK